MHYIIIGGGGTGLAAAQTLLEAPGGHTVELFEASAKLGGRARTSDAIAGFAFDMGPQYLQDPSENPWVAIAESLGFTLIEEKESYKLRIDTGAGWTDEAVTYPPVFAVTEGIEASYEEAKNYPNVIVAPKPTFDTIDQSFGHAVSPYGPFSESAEVWQYLASDRARQKTVAVEKNNCFVQQGLGTMVVKFGESLKQKYGARFTVRLNAPVWQVKHDASGVTITAGGATYPAAACIVTVPVSVLGEGAIRFSPALPSSHEMALRALRMGSYKKLAIRMRVRPEFIVEGTNYYLYQDEPEGIWQYFRLPHYPDVLLVHAAGDFALALDGMRNADVYSLFTTSIKEAYPEQPLYFTADSAMTNWTADRFIRGAYSYTAFVGGGPEDPTSLEARVRLAAPVGRVFIAGEATSTDFYGTMTGAYLEGVRSAMAVLAI